MIEDARTQSRACRELASVQATRFALIVAVLAAAFTPYGVSQSRTSCALIGTVTDNAGAPLPGAEVEITSAALIGGARESSTDRRGRFRFLELPLGEYSVTASLDGYSEARAERVRLSIGLNTEVAIRLIPSGGEQSVDVVASPSAIDPMSSAVSTVLPKEFLRNIPADRDPSHTLNFAPGINQESAYGGGEEAGNAYQVDGVDISDPEGGAPWSFFNYSLTEEVQLVGLGAPAEYGGFTGVVFNSVTRSGGNDHTGTAELFYTDKSLTGTNSDELATIESHREVSVSVGGPIRKDTLWYFASAQYVRDLASEGGPIQTQTDPRVFGKLTWQATPNSLLQGWLEWDHTKVIGRNADEFTPLIATTGEDNPEVVGNITLRTILSPSAILDVSWAGYSGSRHFDPQNGFDIPGRVDAQTGEASDNASLFAVLDRNRNQLNASLSQHVEQFIKGEHNFKFGLELEQSSVRNRAAHPGGVFFSDNEGPSIDPSTGLVDTYTLGFFGGGYQVAARNRRLSLYAQDSWRVTSRVTLNPGLRADLNRGSVAGDTVFQTNPLAPRLGVTWDLNGRGRSILKAHYGRYYDALYSGFYQYLDPDAFAPQTTTQTFDTSGFEQTIATVSSRRFIAAPSLRHPYLDQYILGVDQELGRGNVVSGTLVYRRNTDFIQIVSRDGQFVPVRGVIPGTGQAVTLFDYLNQDSDVLMVENSPGLERTYRAAILSFTRRLKDNWQLSASYVYSQARGNVDNLGADSSPIESNTSDFISQLLQTPNARVNSQGRMTHDQTHQVKLQGTWLVPAWHTQFSANYTFHTGDTWTPVTSCLLTDDGNGVLGDGIRGCHSFVQGQVAYLAQPRGSQRLPSRNELDLHAEWTHDAGSSAQLTLLVNIFNATNQGRATEAETRVGPELGSTATVNFPRNIRLGAALSW